MEISNIERAELDIAEVASALSRDPVDLFATAKRAVEDYNVAVIAEDPELQKRSENLFEAAVWNLNGNSLLSSFESETSPGSVLCSHCAAPPGEVPVWGQSGEFIVTVRGIRVMVSAKTGYCGLRPRIVAHVIDLDKPFFSKTGFRSLTIMRSDGMALLLAVSKAIEEQFAAGLVMVDQECKPDCEAQLARSYWIDRNRGQMTGAPVYFGAGGQLAMAF